MQNPQITGPKCSKDNAHTHSLSMQLHICLYPIVISCSLAPCALHPDLHLIRNNADPSRGMDSWYSTTGLTKLSSVWRDEDQVYQYSEMHWLRRSYYPRTHWIRWFFIEKLDCTSFERDIIICYSWELRTTTSRAVMDIYTVRRIASSTLVNLPSATPKLLWPSFLFFKLFYNNPLEWKPKFNTENTQPYNLSESPAFKYCKCLAQYFSISFQNF